MKGLDFKLARVRAGVKQYEMAAALGICQTRLSAIENGRSKLTPEVEIRLRQILAELADPEGKDRGSC